MSCRLPRVVANGESYSEYSPVGRVRRHFSIGKVPYGKIMFLHEGDMTISLRALAGGKYKNFMSELLHDMDASFEPGL